jgi:hypothetical protein
MKAEQSLAVSREPWIDLEERVRLIIKLWGDGEALDEDRIMEVAWNLYSVTREEVREAIITNLKKGMIRGKFYVLGDSLSKAY